MSRKAIKSINWAALAERIPESEKTALAAFRAKSEKHLQRMVANPESPPKIDWSYYKKSVTTPGLVDQFQKQYETLSIPYPADKYTPEIESEEKQMAKKIDDFIQEVNKAIEQSQREIENIKSMLPFSEMTMEDYKDMYPELAFNPEKPTAWPHIPEAQPEENPDEKQNGH